MSKVRIKIAGVDAVLKCKQQLKNNLKGGENMREDKITLALMYDFDKTLSPKDMQEYSFIPDIGINDPEDFWREANKLASKNSMDNILACMYLMLKKAGEKDRPVTRAAFVDKGENVKLYPGVATWFDRINNYAKKKGADVRHYIISSGLKEIIEGTAIADKFDAVFASEFLYDANGVAKWPAMAINFTSKTQFLYRINKGAMNVADAWEVNRHVPQKKRPVPFSSMIYIGDGMTDIPCMKLVKINGGHSIVVYHPGLPDKMKTAQKIEKDERVNFIAEADYSEGKTLEKIVMCIIDKIVANKTLDFLKSGD